MTRWPPARTALALLLVGLLSSCAARRPPRPAVDAQAKPAVAVPSDPLPAPAPAWPLAGRRFSLMDPKLDLPPRPGPAEPDRERETAVPLDTKDPRYAAYFAELKRRIEDKWSYPSEASRKGQSGQGQIRFVLRKDGSVRTVQIVHSSGVKTLDAFIENAIRLAQPFPPIPASVGENLIPISINFTYTLHGAPPVAP